MNQYCIDDGNCVNYYFFVERKSYCTSFKKIKKVIACTGPC